MKLHHKYLRLAILNHLLMSKVFILSSTRTPLGAFQGGLSSIPATKLGGFVIKESVKKSQVSIEDIDEVFVGNVLSCSLGQNPAKQCAIFGDLLPTTTCTLVNKVCCSSLKAMIVAAQLIKSNEINTSVIVGTENMSLSPRYAEGTRSVKKLGNMHVDNPIDLKDSMMTDGLWDSFNDKHMGSLADSCAKKMGISREDQDRYSIQSFHRAEEGWKSGFLDVTPVNGVEKDEVISKLIEGKVSSLRPCFNTDGTITAATSSALADGAACILLASENYVKSHENQIAKPIAKIIAYSDAERDPKEFTLAPVDAAKKALKKAGLSANQIDLWEVNEAFACVPLMFMKELQLNEDIVNVFGGGISVGHPLGCTGVRIVNTLISALKAKGKKIGLAALCNGGGGANAVIIELID